MSAERGWIIPSPTPYLVHGVQAWVQRHRDEGHEPYPAPTDANPEKWECRCDPDRPNVVAVWRILTPDQIRQKFAHLGRAAKARR